MPEARFRFYAELNDFLPPERRFQDLVYHFRRATVKDRIESFGVPHTEVDLVMVNGASGIRLSSRGWRPRQRLPGFRGARHRRPDPATPRAAARSTLRSRRTPGAPGGVPANGRFRHPIPQLLHATKSWPPISARRTPHPADPRCGTAEAQRHDARLLRAGDRSRRQLAEVIGRFDLARLLRPFSPLHGAATARSSPRPKKR